MAYKNHRAQALEDLKNYRYLKSSLTILPQRIELLKKTLHPSEEGNDSNRNITAEIEQLTHTLELNTIRIASIENALSCLSQSEYNLLNAYYIHRQRGVLENLSLSSYSDRSTIYRRAQKALDHYILAFFGSLS